MAYQKMNPLIKAQWLADLRSDVYPQTHSYLHTSEGYCCLGVLLSHYPHATWEIIDEPGDKDVYGLQDEDGLALTGLRLPMLQWAALDRNAQDHLMTMNDDDGETFLTIADWIDEHL